ncbi:(deoxy)nucleoside triphosphate pyrophosphohydrolase [Rubritalea tangerina]|uniref:8-oxo-dGTP diphosphatase n=2 Tax=Rubritalea tangerina TaxID=430798 RepID=A0ABW4ZCC2_9BACT
MIQVVCGLIVNGEGRLLICQRPEGKAQAGLWEFPGGKIDQGESAREALRRELIEELGCEVEVGEALTSVRYAYDDYSICLIPYICRLLDGQEPKAIEHSNIEWVRGDERLVTSADYALAPADIPILEEWVERFGD